MTKIKGLYLEEFLAQYGLTLDSAKEEVLKKLKEEKAITVHSGPEFHQDETLGTATLLLIARNILNINPEEIEIIRTRDEKEFKGAVLDVGSTYLDHHMEPEKRAHRQDGTKYAAAGLVWALLGDLLVPERFVENVDRKLFKPSDMADNGEGTAIMSFAEIMCPIDDNDDLMECYMETVQHYVRVLERLIKYYNKVSEKGDLTPYLKEGNETGIMILPKYIPWEEEAVYSNVKFVIWKNDDETSEDKYMAKVVPVKEGSFVAKIPFPEYYKGIPLLGKRTVYFNECENEQIKNLTFVHSERFFACSKDLESLLAVIKSVL
jgi:uncharacterized UPF0160 family protein